MTVSTTNPMAELYRRLSAVGLTRKYVLDHILPDWWDDEAATNPAGFTEALMFLSRHAGLDLRSLRDPSIPVAFRDFGTCKFKMSRNVSQEDLALARAMANRAAQLADAATIDNVLPLPNSGAQIRREILGRGHKWVSLSNLVDYCWSVGVPVIHISSFPKAKRPHGLAARVKGRPIIVLFKNDKFSAWLLFILAHELGHIALGHISEDGMLIDEDVEKNERDAEEDEANAFALELLTGAPDRSFRSAGRWPKAQKLADDALLLARHDHIDPGHIVLNYAHTMGSTFWPVANAALNILEPGKGALKTIRERMAAHLDWESLPEDSSDFLMRVSEARRAP